MGLGDRAQCMAVINGCGLYDNPKYQSWAQCSFTAKANGFCHCHQYFMEAEMDRSGFYVLASEEGPLTSARFISREEAQSEAERLCRKTGGDVYICKSIARASSRKVEWAEVDPEAEGP